MSSSVRSLALEQVLLLLHLSAPLYGDPDPVFHQAANMFISAVKMNIKQDCPDIPVGMKVPSTFKVLMVKEASLWGL